MTAGRSRVRLEDASAWVFNRMADAYLARPAYPEALLDALCALAPAGACVADIGAGTGHLALPLARRGFAVTALDPALEMLQRLRVQAGPAALPLSLVHATAEALPLPSAGVDLAIIADALHFINIERAGPELARVLRHGAALAVVTCEFADTPFMRAVAQVMAESAPRRPRDVSGTIAQLAAVVGAPLSEPRRFEDQTPVDAATLEAILRSVSFIGPAMNPQRFAAFAARIAALRQPALWARTFTLYAGIRGGPGE